MKLKTTLGLLAGRSSHFVLSRLGRGSTLPGKLALQFDKDILQNLAKNYEIVVVTGTNGENPDNCPHCRHFKRGLWSGSD